MSDIEHRQRLILGGIFFAPGEAITVRTLRDELENVHGTAHSMDALRAELIRLADVGAVDMKADLVRLTEFGSDAYRCRVKLPSWH
jgi:hypothetical protein